MRLRGITGWTAVVVLMVAAIVSVYLLFRRLAEAGPGLVANQFVLPLLSIAIIVLGLAIAGVLIRNVVRLIMDRRRGILGSRLLTKLVFFFLVLVLPPALVLFYGSAAIIKMTVEAMLRTPVESVTLHARAIVDTWTDSLQRRCLDHARRIADEVSRSGASEPEALRTLFEQRRQESGLDLVVLSTTRRAVARAGGPMPEVDESTVFAESLDTALSRDEPSVGLDYLGEGLLAHAVVPVPGRAGQGVVAGLYLPPELAARMASISAAADDYRQFRVRRSELVALYLSSIALIFLVTVFVATWMGFYLSRRITVPVQKLASATREISAGNLGVRVRSMVGDELGTLVDSFNEMAAQLQESQEVITRSTADLRRSNRALEERRRYIETLVANLSTGVVSLDDHGRVTMVNPAVERILGVRMRAGDRARSRLEVAGLEPLAELVFAEQTDERRESRSELKLERQGEPISVAVQLSPLRGRSGEHLGTLVMLEDLTDLLRAQKAAAWQEVARRIAHEIKNPLTPIQLAAQRLRKKFAADAPDFEAVLPEATASIEREVGALKRLVDEFSEFARMPEVSPGPVDFSQVVESVLALYRGMPNVRWEVVTDPGLDTVVVDAEQMRRVLINLIDNAVTAMDGRGTLRIHVGPCDGPGSLRIEVSDSGPGVSASEVEKMFVPYASSKRPGGGLGLAIVHRVVTEHRGTIRVEDNEPRGARFVIEIPAKEPARMEPA